MSALTNSNFADAVATVSINQYKNIAKTAKPSKPEEWTLLAAMVLQKDTGGMQVISLGTGSKCIGRSKLSPLGDILNDSHAEVMARRGCLRYLYDQIRIAYTNGQSDIFEKVHVQTNRCVLRNGVQFHMFLSHTPCGDASIIPKTATRKRKLEESSDSESDAGGDIFRTGAKCVTGSIQDSKLPGCNYHNVLAVRTKPGRGDPTLSLSCSDKMARWCVLGLQGALLSLLIDSPIYLSTIVVASNCPYSEHALHRALIARVDKPMDLPPPFAQKSPLFLQSTLPFEDGEKSGGHPCPASMVWTALSGQPKGTLEVAVLGKRQGVTKTVAQTPAGQVKICKAALMKEFLAVLGLLNDRKLREIPLRENPEVIRSVTYLDLKQKAIGYQQAWTEVRKHCFPEWISKPQHLSQFTSQSVPTVKHGLQGIVVNSQKHENSKSELRF